MIADNVSAVDLVSRGFVAVYCSRASLRPSAPDWEHSHVSGNVLLQLCHRWAEDQRFLCSGHCVGRYSLTPPLITPRTVFHLKINNTVQASKLLQ